MGLGIEIDRWMDEAPVPMSEKVYQTIEKLRQVRWLQVPGDAVGRVTTANYCAGLPDGDDLRAKHWRISHNPAEDEL